MTDKQMERARAMYIHGGANEEQIAKALKLPLATVRWYIDHGTVREDGGSGRRRAAYPSERSTADPIDAVIDDLLGGKR